MKEIIFTSKCTINGIAYTEGDKLRVSPSIFTDVTEVQKCAKLYIKKKHSKKTEEV